MTSQCLVNANSIALCTTTPEVSPFTSPSTTLNASNKDSEKLTNKFCKELTPLQLWKTRLRRLWPRANAPSTDCEDGIEANEFSPRVRKLSACRAGYPRLAAYLDSDDSFMIFRRFGYIQARLILEKQDELRKLENGLDELDEEIGNEHAGYLNTRDLKPNLATTRKTLMDKLEKTFCEYAQLMIAARDMVGLNNPASKDYRSVSDYIYNSRPQVDSEETWIHYKEDLVTLRPGREHAWLDSTVEYLLKWFHCDFVARVFCSKEVREKTDGLVVYYTRSRIDKLVVGMIVCILLVLLIVPIYLLYHLVTQMGNRKTDALCIGVLLIFTLAFSAILSLFTRARRHEILAAAAGYCAVLVVFLGNVTPGEK